MLRRILRNAVYAEVKSQVQSQITHEAVRVIAPEIENSLKVINQTIAGWNIHEVVRKEVERQLKGETA